MADTPETPPVKRARKASAAKPVSKPAVKTPKVKVVKAASPVPAVKAAPVKKAATPKKPGNGTAAHGWTAQIAPIKEQAEKAAKAAVDKLNAVDWQAQVAPIKEQASKAAKVATDKLNAVDWKAHIDPIKEQAGKTAKSAAGTAKDKTGSTMHSLAKLISETAGTVDAKLGPQYGDYARQAAQQVAGAADTLDSKDVDQLMTEARDFVRKSPAVAIGAAAVVGFVLMRLAKGSDDKG